MKKLIFILCLLIFFTNFEKAFGETNSFGLESKENSSKIIKKSLKQNKRYDINLIFDTYKKNNDLVKITKFKPVNSQLYINKLANDNLAYQQYTKLLSDVEYPIYKILDKLLRASNLQYQNWKIFINTDSQTVDTAIVSSNSIIIDKSLYENLSQNNDALAFVIAHELSHLILAYNQIFVANTTKISEMEKQIAALNNPFDEQRNNSRANNDYAVLGNSASCFAYETAVTSLNLLINRVYAQERLLEANADVEALILMTRAGYDPQKAFDSLDFLINSPNVYTNRTTHLDIKNRHKLIADELEIIDLENLKIQGMQNLYKSKPTSLKKSNDKTTVILLKTQGFEKYKYISDTKENKLIRKAYVCYLNNDFDLAKQYFLKAYDINRKNYISPLFLSYIEEYDFKVNRCKKSLKKAKYWVKKAYSINQNDKYVLQQREDIQEIYKRIKDTSKNK